MSKPNLFRSGNTTPPRFDNVRAGTDIIIVDGCVGPTSGGVSAFHRKDSLWPDDNTWVIESSTPLGDGLQVINGCGTHWLIAPSQEMALETYKGHLTSLNSKAVPYDKSASPEAAPQVRVLKTEWLGHSNDAINSIYMAFACVVRARIPITGWDENDYEYVATLAEALEDGTVPLSAVVWDDAASRSASGGWSRERAFTAHAVSAFIKHEYARAADDEDLWAEVANDMAYLSVVMGLEDENNPFAAIHASESAA